MDSPQDLNSVLDLMFLYTNIEEFNNYTISPDFWGLSNHTSLSVYIIIKEKFIQDRKLAIVKNSKKEKKFINKLRSRVSYIDTTNIHNCEILEEVTQEFASIAEELWYKHSKYGNILKHSGMRSAIEI